MAHIPKNITQILTSRPCWLTHCGWYIHPEFSIHISGFHLIELWVWSKKKNLFINIINLIIYHILSAFFTAFSFQFLHSGGLSVWLLFPWKWSLILIILTDFLHFYIFLTSLDFLDFSTEHISANVPFFTSNKRIHILFTLFLSFLVVCHPFWKWQH